ncbi:hypothetical protein [Pimelobacter simplex]|uniref:hypothetical protein n=1 Tax=Nocardioides simplex TaxID=2045 RepID=UPI003AAF5D9E
MGENGPDVIEGKSGTDYVDGGAGAGDHCWLTQHVDVHLDDCETFHWSILA